MPKYRRLNKPNLQLCYDPASDIWLHASNNPYHRIKWKHLPKYAREAIPILNIAGHREWVQDMGEMYVSREGGIVNYVILDPIQMWEIASWHTRR